MRHVVLFVMLAACRSHATQTTTTTTTTTPTSTTTTTTTTTTTKPDRPKHEAPARTCPQSAPNVGHPCDVEGLSCNFGPLYVCNAGKWEARFSR